MQFIGKSKIGKKRSKPTITYPLIRLPHQYDDIIGTPINIYETEHNKCTAFVVVLNEEKRDRFESQTVQPDLRVGQLSPKVVQLEKETNIESRLSALESSTEVLESKIDILIELNFQNNELSNNKTPKEDGLGRIRTGDLRRVKAMS